MTKEIDSPMQVPLVELLARVPTNSRLIVEDKRPTFGSHHIPVGRLCHEAIERIKELEAQLASFAQGAKISIPTITMEQEFASYERRGFQRGVKHSEREYQTRYMLLEAQYKLLMDHCVALVAMKSPAPIMLERDRVIETDAFNLATKFTEIRKALEAENAELRKDAERYRWLREWGSPELCACINGVPNYIGETEPGEGARDLDDAIDAAMQPKDRL